VIKNIVLSLLLGFSALSAAAQVQIGIYPYGSFDTPGPDSIDRGSLNVHFSIPVVDKQGRGVPFQYQLVYDSLVWSPVSSAGTQTWTPATDWGLHGQLNEGFQGYLSYTTTTVKCEEEDGDWIYKTYLSDYIYHDGFGVGHPFEYVVDNCALTTTGRGLPSRDGSGYSYNGVDVTSADGKLINAPVNNQSSSGSVTDSNGNTVSNNGNGTFTDTLGLTALTITGSGTPSSPKVFTYSTPTGTAAVTVTYKAYTVQTNFGCTVGEYSGSQDLVNTITLADGSVYQLNYEATPVT
jgi:hypothetical protein